MNQSFSLKTTTLAVRNSIRLPIAKRAFLIVELALVWFALSPAAPAQLPSPTPDGGYPNNNTAEGTNALFSLTIGTNNTADGFQALFSNASGAGNTANGAGALQNNNADDNTASGFEALLSNTTGSNNTANGAFALQSNTTGSANTASGFNALLKNTTGVENTAHGGNALSNNTTASCSTANGYDALRSNTTGTKNTATGWGALELNTIGGHNTANGYEALDTNTTGSNNTALGFLAGINLTTGSNNIDIGANVLGVAGEAGKIRIGKQGTQNGTFIAGIFGVTMTGSPVVVNSSGKLGISGTSSIRFKEAVKPIDKASEAILALKPVSFRYKHELDPDGIPQFGLIAEEVDKVNPDLVIRDDEGKVMSVRYEAVNAMLLNEFLKEHRKVEEQDRKAREQEATIAQLKQGFAKQQEQIEALTAGLRKVSARVEMSRPAAQMVLNNQ
jgi:hypothetical protein